jgi:hypothetical protein
LNCHLIPELGEEEQTPYFVGAKKYDLIMGMIWPRMALRNTSPIAIKKIGRTAMT